MAANSTPADLGTRVGLAHISDTHLGLRQYETRDGLGRNIRQQDILRAYRNCIDDISATRLPLVIHSGDVFESPVVTLAQQKLFQASLQMLTTPTDGLTRTVIVISGNHDQPADVREPAAIELNTPIDGVHIVTSTYAVIDLGLDPHADESLANVVVHAIPHDQLRVVDWDTVTPIEGRINILTSHGVVGGSDLYKRTKGREYAIPVDVVTRGWHYVALGHWHKRTPIAVGEYTPTTTPIWYAGSIENNDFGEAQGPNGTDARGWLEVYVNNEVTAPTVIGHDLPIRPMYTLEPVDAAERNAADVEAALIAAVADVALTDTVVRQQVINMSREEWALVNLDKVRDSAKHLMHYELRPPKTSAGNEPGTESAPVTLMQAVHQAAAELFADDPDKPDVETLAVTLLTAALAESGSEQQEADEDAGTVVDVREASADNNA